MTTKEDVVVTGLEDNDVLYLELASARNGVGVHVTTTAGTLTKKAATVTGNPIDDIEMDPALDAVVLTKRAYFTLSLQGMGAAKSSFLSVPVAGRVTRLWVVTDADISDETVLTPKIDGVPIAGGAITLGDTLTAGNAVGLVLATPAVIGFFSVLEVASDGAADPFNAMMTIEVVF